LIPKTIHYLWFSDNKPQRVENCIASWRKNLADYQIIEWNKSNFPFNDFLWTREAFSVQKWAFVTDFFRLWVLKELGGIYLDADVEVNKNFDSFLDKSLFIGTEFASQLGPHVIGSVKGHNFIKKCFDYYLDRHFIIDGAFDETPMPLIITKIFMVNYKYYNKIISFDDTPLKIADMTIYNDTFFTINTYNGCNICCHNYLASWVEGGQKFTISDATSSYFIKKFFCYDIFRYKKIHRCLIFFIPVILITFLLKLKLRLKNNRKSAKINYKSAIK
jgi:mannosyltransferase OCH1-like enzyme